MDYPCNEWVHVFNWGSMYKLEKFYNSKSNKLDFRVVRLLGNMPEITIKEIQKTKNKNHPSNTLLSLGYQYQMRVVLDSCTQSANEFKQNLTYYIEANNAISTFKEEIARTMNLFIN